METLQYLRQQAEGPAVDGEIWRVGFSLMLGSSTHSVLGKHYVREWGVIVIGEQCSPEAIVVFRTIALMYDSDEVRYMTWPSVGE